MKRKMIAISFVLTAITIIAFYLFSPSDHYICLKAFSNTLQMEYKGIILNKYIDATNHLAPTLIILTDKDSLKLIDYRDKSGLFEFLDKGDSIIKSKNSPIILVKRNNSIKHFKINYDCTN